jgi:hypothetical protein
MIRRLAIDIIRLDFQRAENLIEETVLGYVELLQDGKKLEPIKVRFDGKYFLLQDGFHRLEAARRFGASIIIAEVSPGTLAEMEAEFQQCLKQKKTSLAETQ